MKKSVRLSPHIKPNRYQIMLKPDLDAFKFEGNETIFLDIDKPTTEITLHSKELQILEVEMRAKDFHMPALKTIYDEKAETATFQFAKKIPTGKGELKIAFRGILNDKMRGFYRSKYTHAGKEKHMATTQFEATDARRALPSFDEPGAKAIFDVTLMVPSHTTAISNTIETEVLEHDSGYKVIKFAPTPKMSTYLLAFIVGEFEWIEGKTKDGVLTRVFVTPGKKHQAKFALDVAIKTLEFYNKYFDIPYPLPVLDLIAIPDFTSGAMENWGAVTYRESALLVDPEHSSAANKQWVALVIAHELAHQWFGNLVTMEWWTHLWLNEGFASYIEYLAVNQLFPKWDIWTQFAYNDLGAALHLDSLKNTHPIEIEVHHPDEIGEIFDEVSYSKGASVIRMLANYLGEKNFRNGLRHHLKKHAYGNASTIDLWRSFEKISGKPVEKIMKNWTAQPGYPVVRIIEQKNKLLLKQSRFYSSPISDKQSTDSTLWQVPVQIMDSKSSRKNYLLTGKQLVIDKPKGSWAKFNIGETGFFRTDYPSQLLADLRDPITQKKLPALDRLGVIRDAFALAEAGHLPTTEALGLTQGYGQEHDYTVWIELASGVDAVESLMFGQPGHEELRGFILNIFSPLAAKIGWSKKPSESHTTTLLRSLALFHAGYYGDKNVLKKVKELFKNRKKVPADIRGVVYNLAAHQGSYQEFKALKDWYIKETLHEEKNRIARAMTAFHQPQILKQALEFAMSKYVRPQDSPSLIASVLTNPYGKDLAWAFMKKNWKTLEKRYAGSHIFPRLIKPLGHFNDPKKAIEIEKFFKAHRPPGAERAVLQVVEKIQSSVAWLKRDGPKITRWLKSNV